MDKTNKRMGLRSLVAAFVLAIAFMCVLPGTAFGLTTGSTTAKPNEDGGTGVIGGLPTRLTWEATVDEGDSVQSLELVLPEGGSFDGSTTKITALKGLDRSKIEGEASPQGNKLNVKFSEPLNAGHLIRLEVTDMRFPPQGGSVVVGGTYVSGGETKQLQDAPPIETIANTFAQTIVSWLDHQPWVQAWNSNQFLGMFFKPQLIVTSLFALLPGWFVCLGIVIASYPFAVVLGLIFALMKVSRFKLLRAIAIVYINVLRGTPLFLQIYIVFFGLPMMNINIDNYILGIIVMAINSSAYLAEIFRAGIESIPAGQYEAASSLGMGHLQTMVNIILPQTIRRVIPTVTSDFITAFKDTSLLSSVGVMELMMFSKNLTSITGNMTPYVTAGIFYLIVTLPLIKVVTVIEKRMARSERGGGKRPKAKADAVKEEVADAI
ncbi:MAG: amino acid ABC transporter permease [Atopobiaceae bacterium]|nr:amino acid ABC transporter permease [Atopobiaceae bacterium]